MKKPPKTGCNCYENQQWPWPENGRYPQHDHRKHDDQSLDFMEDVFRHTKAASLCGNYGMVILRAKFDTPV